MRVSWIVTLSAIPVVYSQSITGCSWTAIGPDKTAIFSDLSLPITLTDVEVYYYSSCTQVVTALKTVYIDGTPFAANLLFLPFPVTLTSLTEGETINFSETLIGTDQAVDGGGEYSVVVPLQVYSENPTTITNTVAITSTVTSISTQQSGGIKPAAVGGIAAGIVGGFLLLGALAFFLILRPKNQETPMEYNEEGQARMNEQETKGFGSINEAGGRLSTA